MCYRLQLFRRVAAALPGMDSTENKPPEDSILLNSYFACAVLYFVVLKHYAIFIHDYVCMVFFVYDFP